MITARKFGVWLGADILFRTKSIQWGNIDPQTATASISRRSLRGLKKRRTRLQRPDRRPAVRTGGADYLVRDGRNERRFAQMVEEITGFVGPSYSDFRGSGHPEVCPTPRRVLSPSALAHG